MGNNLYAASSQWASRPADERFWTLQDLHAACVASRDGSATAQVAAKDLRLEANGPTLALIGQTGTPAQLTHYAFGQLARSIQAPADYLRELPTNIAADAMNAGLARFAPTMSERNVLFHKNGALTVRAIVSEVYERVWNADVCRFLLKLGEEGWKAPAGRHPGIAGVQSRIATDADILPGQINIHAGDAIAPSGLYASDHDMFAFLVSPDHIIEDGAGGALMRGCFFRNSEVGDGSLVVTFFRMQNVCGNHIVWGAEGVHEIRVRHVGADPMRKALAGFEGELRRFSDSAPEEERMIHSARRMVLGHTKEEVLDAIIKYARGHSLPIARKRVDEAYEITAKHEDWYGSPRTLWGVVAGLTHGSQSTGYADQRNDVDRAAGQLLNMAF